MPARPMRSLKVALYGPFHAGIGMNDVPAQIGLLTGVRGTVLTRLICHGIRSPSSPKSGYRTHSSGFVREPEESAMRNHKGEHIGRHCK